MSIQKQDQFNKGIVITSILLSITVILFLINFWWLGAQQRLDHAFLAHANDLRVLSQMLAKNADEAADGDEQAFKILAATRDSFLQHLRSIDSAKQQIHEPTLSELHQIWMPVQNSVADILARYQRQVTDPATIDLELYQDLNKKSAEYIYTTSDQLLATTTKLRDAIALIPQQRFIGIYSGLILGIMVCSILCILFYRIYNAARIRISTIRTQNTEHQLAVTRLVEELGELADGDLRVQATATTSFISDIANSFNFTIEALRKLVFTIHKTATQLAAAACHGNSIAEQTMLRASFQARQIVEVSRAVNDMAVSIENVSSNANESALVAKQSVSIAHQGATAVQATIAGMDGIRAKIQETAKRMKRLGESSQEIGDIVSMITDIAEQTNILAINAAIQAAMAGESGRGFAVVADEVQRLAERSSGAAKQIETLVHAIQNDTSHAVISMEQSTAQVVEGTQLANNAGIALNAIEEVSEQLAKLIQQISVAAGSQAATAVQIAGSMGAIQESTNTTASSVCALTGAVENLSQLASELERSVCGFKLPISSSPI